MNFEQELKEALEKSKDDEDSLKVVVSYIEGYIILRFSDGSCASITSVMRKMPRDILEVLIFGGNCALIALYMKNRRNFLSLFGIISPQGLIDRLRGSGVNFEKNTMLEATDFEKIANFLNVSFTITCINAGRAIEFFPDQTFGRGFRLNPITNDLQMMEGQSGGGGHYLIDMIDK